MSITIVATDFMGRSFERTLSAKEVYSLYDGSLNFKDIIRELAEQAVYESFISG